MLEDVYHRIAIHLFVVDRAPEYGVAHYLFCGFMGRRTTKVGS